MAVFILKCICIYFDCFVTLQCMATCINFWILKLVSGMKPAALERACFHSGAPPTLLPQKIKGSWVGKVRRLFGGTAMGSFSEENRVMIPVCLAYFLGFYFCWAIFHGTMFASIAHSCSLSSNNLWSFCCVPTAFR